MKNKFAYISIFCIFVLVISNYNAKSENTYLKNSPARGCTFPSVNSVVIADNSSSSGLSYFTMKNYRRGNRPMTTKEFIKKSKHIHGERYDYSETEYKNWITPVIIKCKIHGEFKIIPNNHTSKKGGCPKCNGGGKITQDEFIKKAKEIHGDRYNYERVNYKNNRSPIKIICSIHGEFYQAPYSHLSGAGCRKCFNDSHRLNKDIIIKKASFIHNNKYSYDLSKYTNSRNKIKIICNEHGLFEQRLDVHLAGVGCPLCHNPSRGENIIALFLKNNKIKFIRQKKLDGCTFIRKLKFDFYLPVLNVFIEYDGMQHFKEIKYFGGKEKLEITKRRDNVKNSFCKKNKIKLLRISCTENIIDVLSKLLIENKIEPRMTNSELIRLSRKIQGQNIRMNTFGEKDAPWRKKKKNKNK